MLYRSLQLGKGFGDGKEIVMFLGCDSICGEVNIIKVGCGCNMSYGLIVQREFLLVNMKVQVKFYVI